MWMVKTVMLMLMWVMWMMMLLQAIKHDYFSYFPDRYLLSITMIFGDFFSTNILINFCFQYLQLSVTFFL